MGQSRPARVTRLRYSREVVRPIDKLEANSLVDIPLARSRKASRIFRIGALFIRGPIVQKEPQSTPHHERLTAMQNRPVRGGRIARNPRADQIGMGGRMSSVQGGGSSRNVQVSNHIAWPPHSRSRPQSAFPQQSVPTVQEANATSQLNCVAFLRETPFKSMKGRKRISDNDPVFGGKPTVTFQMASIVQKANLTAFFKSPR